MDKITFTELHKDQEIFELLDFRISRTNIIKKEKSRIFGISEQPEYGIELKFKTVEQLPGLNKFNISAHIETDDRNYNVYSLETVSQTSPFAYTVESYLFGDKPKQPEQ